MNSFGRRNFSIALIVINVSIFFLTYLFPQIVRYFAVYPFGLLRLGYIWTPLTYMFVHGDFTHLLFNMVCLVFAGPSVEQAMGTREFRIYYLLTGTLAGIFSLFAYMTAGLNVFILGSSGALYAVLLAFATYFPRANILLFYILPIRAPYALMLFAFIDLILHFQGAGGVAHLTHLSGLAFGFLYFLIRLRINPIQAMRDGR